MSRFKAGILQRAGGPPDYVLNPFNIETDWTIGSLPSGWTESGGFSGVPTYTGTGIYNATDVDQAVWISGFTPRDVGAMTLIVGYNIVAWDDQTTVACQINTPTLYGGTFMQGGLHFNNTFNAGEHSYISAGSTDPDETIVFDNTAPTTGLIVTAGVCKQNGDRVTYLLDDAGTLAQPYSDTPPAAPVPINTINLQMIPFDFGEGGSGTPGNLRIAFTYIGFDEELNQSAIQAKATSWGWT